MKNKDLIKLLQKFPPNIEIMESNKFDTGPLESMFLYKKGFVKKIYFDTDEEGPKGCVCILRQDLNYENLSAYKCLVKMGLYRDIDEDGNER